VEGHYSLSTLPSIEDARWLAPRFFGVRPLLAYFKCVSTHSIGRSEVQKALLSMEKDARSPTSHTAFFYSHSIISLQVLITLRFPLHSINLIFEPRYAESTATSVDNDARSPLSGTTELVCAECRVFVGEGPSLRAYLPKHLCFSDTYLRLLLQYWSLEYFGVLVEMGIKEKWMFWSVGKAALGIISSEGLV